jgi:hypothetical protein
MLSIRVIDGLSVYRPNAPLRERGVELTGGNSMQQAAVRNELDVLMTASPTSAEFRVAYARAETLSRSAGIAIGLSRRDEALLRQKIEEATAAHLSDTRAVAAQQWSAARRQG